MFFSWSSSASHVWKSENIFLVNVSESSVSLINKSNKNLIFDTSVTVVDYEISRNNVAFTRQGRIIYIFMIDLLGPCKRFSHPLTSQRLDMVGF